MTERVLRVPKVAEKLSISVSTVWQYARQGKIPKPIKLSPRVSVWKESDIDAFLEQQEGAA